MKKVAKIITSAVVAAAVAATGISLGVHFGYADKKVVQKEYNIKPNNDALSVAVISDLQLPNSKNKDTHQYESFEKTLTVIRDKNPDVLIIAGDYTDVGTRKAWASYKEIYDKVMADSKEPIVMEIMGNHDFWLPYFGECFEIPTPAKQIKRFTKYTGQPLYSHQTVNGYHFICWSSSDGSYDKSYENKDQMRAEIEKAIEDDPSKPVFVITHINPSDTAYGSDEWGNDDINEVLKDYPQVVSLSGHSHYSLLDERSIFQGSYTALTTQSLDYIELESGKYNGSVPKDAYGNRNLAEDMPLCLFMNIDENKVTIERLEANTGKTAKEPWILTVPFDKPSAYTLKSRKAGNRAPVLDSNLTVSVEEITDVNGEKQNAVSFKAGRDDDFVHSYRLRFLDKNKQPLTFAETDYDGNVLRYDAEGNKVSADSDDYDKAEEKQIDNLLYFSDFCLGLENMSDTALLRLPKNMPKNTKYIEVTAIDSWGAESNPVACTVGE